MKGKGRKAVAMWGAKSECPKPGTSCNAKLFEHFTNVSLVLAPRIHVVRPSEMPEAGTSKSKRRAKQDKKGKGQDTREWPGLDATEHHQVITEEAARKELQREMLGREIKALYTMLDEE